MARSAPAFERHLSDLYPGLDDLFRAGEVVERLQETEGWKAVVELLDAEVDAIEAQMQGATTALSRADYAIRHGRIGGLRAAVGAADTIVLIARQRRVEQESRHEAGAESLAER